MNYFSKGSPDSVITGRELRDALYQAFSNIGKRERILILPPDITRYHSQAGMVTQIACEYYGKAVKAILPALGTHMPMTQSERKRMFGNIPETLFVDHDWRNDIVTLGEIPSETLKEVSEGKVDYPWPVQVNNLLVEGGFDLILSVGQVVPHEVIGMANYTKNIFVGAGGPDGINRSHFLGAVYGMERIMGRTENPVRMVLDKAFEEFGKELPVVFVQTVIGADSEGESVLRGLFASDDRLAFEQAAALSRDVNITLLDKPVKKVVVYLDPEEYRSTWLGNKSIYRTRMLLADGGELVVLAPGVKEFGEDTEIDRLIRKYGYKGTGKVLASTAREQELQENLSAAAHLIHGSSEGRFTVTYCPGGLTKQEITQVGYRYGDLQAMNEIYNPKELRDGFHTVNGEEFYFISNPALGLWAAREIFTGKG